MQVITLLNEKGGVGKTTLSINIGAGMAIRGKRVLLIDSDAQGSATSQLDLPDDMSGLYQLLVKDAEWNQVLREPQKWAGTAEVKGRLLVLPGNGETRVIPMLVDDVRLLSERLAELDGHVDVVIVDTSPTPSLLHSMIYVASDYMVYPTQCELLSLRGLAKSVAHMQRMKDTRKAFNLDPTQLLGVQPTMFEAHTLAHKHGMELIQKQFGGATWRPIIDRTVWKQASFQQQTIFAYAPESEAALEMWEVLDNIEEGIA
jgi:chromosome partitioning protein